MYCQKCGSKITEGSMFCSTCGTKAQADGPQAQTYQTQYRPPNEAQYQSPGGWQQTQQPKSYNGYSVASLVLGIIGLIFPIFITSILAVVFASISSKSTGGEKDGMAKAGFIMGWISLGLSILVVVLVVVLVAVTTASVLSSPYFWENSFYY